MAATDYLQFDFNILYNYFAQLFKDTLNLTVIELNPNAKAPDDDYAVFDVINPHLNNKNRPQNESANFDCMVSFTSYSHDKVSSLNLCEEMRAVLDSFQTDLSSKNSGIAVKEMEDTNQRYPPETNVVAYMFGFDVRLNLLSSFVDSGVDLIEKINDVTKES